MFLRFFLGAPALVLLVTACGGSSGGGALSSPADANMPTDADPTLTGNFNCGMAITPEFLDSLEGEVLPNISAGCDYVIPASIDIQNVESIEPGVTIAVAEDVVVEISSISLMMQGTSENPIIVQALNATKPWGKFVFNSRDITLDWVVFSDGGSVSDGPDYSTDAYEDAAVSIEFGGTGSGQAEVTNSTFRNSGTSGLFLGSRSSVDVLTGNQFINNSNFSLMIATFGGGDLINTLDENSFTGDTKQPVLFDMQNFDGLISFGGPNKTFTNVGVPYMFANVGSNGLDSTNNLIFMPGTEFWFTPESTLSRSRLLIFGTQENPVIFSGLPDDKLNWGGVVVGSGSVMRHFEIIGGGAGAISDGSSLFLSGSGFNKPAHSNGYTIEFGRIKDSLGSGLKCSTNGTTFTNNILALDITGSVFGDIDSGCELTESSIASTTELVELDQLSYDAYSVHAADCTNVLTNVSVSTPTMFENTESDCDYLVIGQNIYTSNVSIEAGTTFVFERASELSIDVVQASGTEITPILFRGNSAQAGYWRALELTGNGNKLEHVLLQDAGGLDGSYNTSIRNLALGQQGSLIDAVNQKNYALGITGLDASVTSTQIRNTLGIGLYAPDGASFFETSSNIINDVGTLGAYISPRVVPSFINGFSIDATTSSAFGNGVYISDSVIRDNTYSVLGTPFGSTSSGFSIDNNTFSLDDIGVPWIISDIEISDSELLINSGVELRVLNEIELTGDTSRMSFLGTEAAPVMISGIDDDPAEINWRGIRVSSNETNIIIDNTILNGAEFALGFTSSRVTGPINVSNTTIANGEFGVSCDRFGSPDITLTNVAFENLSGTEVGEDCGIR